MDDYLMFSEVSNFWKSSTNQTPYEMLKEYRSRYYKLEGEFNKLRRGIEMHPEKYLWSCSIQPQMYYELENAKRQYENCLELVKLLDSKPQQKKESNIKINKSGVIKKRKLL